MKTILGLLLLLCSTASLADVLSLAASFLPSQSIEVYRSGSQVYLRPAAGSLLEKAIGHVCVVVDASNATNLSETRTITLYDYLAQNQYTLTSDQQAICDKDFTVVSPVPPPPPPDAMPTVYTVQGPDRNIYAVLKGNVRGAPFGLLPLGTVCGDVIIPGTPEYRSTSIQTLSGTTRQGASICSPAK